MTKVVQIIFEKAEKLTEWGGYIYWEECPEELHYFAKDYASNGYWESAEDLLGAIKAFNKRYLNADDQIEVPYYVWCCGIEQMRHADVRDLFAEDLEDATYEDAWDDVPESAIAALQEALNAFYQETDKIVSYSPNYRKALILNPGGGQ